MKKEHLKIKVSELKVNPKNPKNHDDKLIKDSIKDLGFVDDIVIDEKNIILSGHGRLKALEELGTKDVDVIRVSGWTQKQKDRYLLLSNKSVEKGGWDFEKLMENFKEEELLESGFNNDDLGNYWDSLLEIEDDGFNIQKALDEIDKPVSRDGDIYELGRHRLMCGDGTKEEDVKKLIGKNKIQMVYCDPPYNIGFNYATGRKEPGGKYKGKAYGGKYSNKQDSKKDEEYAEFINKTIKNALHYAKPNAHIFYWCDERYIYLIQTLYKENKIRSNRVCLWIKNNFTLTPQVAFNKVYESCVYGTIGKPYLNNKLNNLNEVLNKEVRTGNVLFDDILDIINIWLVKRDNSQDYQHPTQKPLALAEKPLKRCTKFNDNVLDLFGGSGSTLISAEQLKRNAFLMEIDPIFCDVIIKRFEQLTGVKAKKV